MSSFNLNEQQMRAAGHGRIEVPGGVRCGPLLIIAGAGTGKTATLAHRVGRLILDGVDPGRIMLLTFTRRAAQEMTSRAERIVAEALAGRHAGTAPAVRLPWSGTFHSLAGRFLREFHLAAGLDAAFSVIDRADAADVIDLLRHELGFSNLKRRFPRKDTCLAIYSHRVNSGRDLQQVIADHFPWCDGWEPELRQLFGSYVERKQANAVLDYDDLLLYWHEMLADASLARRLGESFDHILVDEYQDTNALQAGILMRLKPDGAGLTVVGDDAQAIYAFRAATVDNILDFPAAFEPPAQVIALQRNYRSTQPLLDAANVLIAEGRRQYRKELQAERGGGERPRLVTLLDERAQAAYVVSRVLENREQGLLLRRQAVLFRNSHHSDQLELELLRGNIPFVKYGGLKFLEAAHVKDLLALLRWADNPRNGIAAFRVLQLMPGMGPAQSARCLTLLAASGHSLAALAGFRPPPAALEYWRGLSELMPRLAAPQADWPGQVEQARRWYQPLLEQIYESAQVRAADLDMLEQVSGQFASRERFLTELALDPPQASGDLAGPPLKDEDYLILSTVHSAKGQEWDAVFVLNVADGNFPSEFAGGDEALLEEERRLLYVAMTRAREQLHLLEPQRYFVTQQSRHGDAHVYAARSRFLSPAVLATLDRQGWGEPQPGLGEGGDLPRVDVAARARQMW